MNESSRRQFLHRTGAGLSASALAFGAVMDVRAQTGRVAPKGRTERLTLGMASYTFRKFDLETTLAMTKRLGLKRISFKDFHLPMDSTPEAIRAAAVKTRDAGLELYGCGVVYMKTEAEVNRAFDYAKAGGMEIIIGVPEHNLLELVNRKVQEYNIKVAIHNHGPCDKVYPSPQTAYDKIRDLDPRIGLCLDIGHAQRLGIDPSEAARKFAKRLLDVHIKDVSASSAEGTTVEIGRGVIDIPRFLRTLIDIRYTGTMALEYEKDESDPLPGSAESIGYLRGALAVL